MTVVPSDARPGERGDRERAGAPVPSPRVVADDNAESSAALTRVVFVNENLGGHATMHQGLESALVHQPAVRASFVHVPGPGFVRRAVAAPVPGLARLDLDLQPLRFQLAQSYVARRLLRDELADADVVHLYTQNVGLLATGLLRDHPVVVSTDATNAQGSSRLPYRSPTRWTPVASRLVQPLERRLFDMAGAVVTHSAWAAGSVCDYGVDPARVHVIPFGIEVPSEVVRVETDPPEITFIGATMARKGGWWLLDVFRRRLAGRCTLNLVTREPVPPTPGVRVYNDLRPGDPEHSRILGRTAVFVFPSEIDPFGYAPIEAMAMEVPVVANRIGAVDEIVVDGETGIIVSPRDEDATVDAILGLLGDEALRRVMGQRGRSRVLERFDARVTTAQLAGVLARVAGR